MWHKYWEFHTRNLDVVFEVADCDTDPADLFEFEEDIEAVRNGDVTWFDARVRVLFRDGTELGSDYLGCCSYNSVREFYVSHRNSDPMNRNCSIMRRERGENINIGHYFPEMVAIACEEARKQLRQLARVKVRG